MRFASVFLLGALLANATTYLEPNRGQSAARAAFVASTSAGTIGAGPGAIAFLRRDGTASTIQFMGASTRTAGIGEQPVPGVTHYVHDCDPARWTWDVPRFRAVRYRAVYPGIDLLYRAVSDTVEFDFLLAPGADPQRIRLQVPVDARMDTAGNLVLHEDLLHAPAAWQSMDGKRVPIAARFVLRGKRASIELGAYDRSLRVTIDPVIQLATFLGGSDNDNAVQILTGPDGGIYLAGNTSSSDFPAAIPSDSSPLLIPGKLWLPSAYVSRMNADATRLDWSMIVGGSARQSPLRLKQDNSGNLYLWDGPRRPTFRSHREPGGR